MHWTLQVLLFISLWVFYALLHNCVTRVADRLFPTLPPEVKREAARRRRQKQLASIRAFEARERAREPAVEQEEEGEEDQESKKER